MDDTTGLKHVITQRVLHWTRVASQELISKSLMERSYVDVVPGLVADHLAVNLTSYVLTDHVLDRTQWVTREVPASWWELFKMEVLDAHRVTRWFVRRYPPKMKTWKKSVTFNEDRNYVNLRNLPVERFGYPIVYEHIDIGDWEHA